MWRNKLAALIEVRKIIALSFTALIVVMALRGQIEAREIITFALMVISFYFGKSNGDTGKPNE